MNSRICSIEKPILKVVCIGGLKILFNQKEARNDDTTMKSAIFESVPQF
jgi:hypothetical protein